MENIEQTKKDENTVTEKVTTDYSREDTETQLYQCDIAISDWSAALKRKLAEREILVARLEKLS